MQATAVVRAERPMCPISCRATLCTIFFSLFPFRHIVKDAAFFQLFVFRQFLQHDLIELGGLIVVEHHNAEKLIEPQEFIGLEEVRWVLLRVWE